MTTALRERLSQELGELKARSRLRALRPPSGVDFTSNDYLGLTRHPKMQQALGEALARGPIGSGGSRLLRGNHREHEELEEAAARFFGAENALYFNSGFDANLALFSALPSRRGALVLDEKVHASVKEGARASFARKFTARHNDPRSFEESLKKARRAGARDLFISVESVYSMEGDTAPVEDLARLAVQYDATLVVDEAHATGVLGPTGRGLTEGLAGPVIALHTCGKALGASGALVVADRLVIEYLLNTARPFLYSTAASPLIAAGVRRALALVDEEPERRRRLLELAGLARTAISEALSRWPVSGGRTQILPIVIGDDAQTLAAASALQRKGFDVRAIRPPTVPEAACRLRVSLSCERSEEEIRALAAALEEVEEHGR